MAIPNETLVEIRANLKEAETALKELDAEISKARTAGLDVTDMQKQAETLRTQIRQLKSVYGKA